MSESRENTTTPWSSDWSDLNATGVNCAAEERWEDALDAFLQGAQNLDVTNVDQLDALAVVTSNAASAHLRTGSVADAIRASRASLDVRRSRFPDDSMVAARAKSDLAAILCVSGELEEARALLAEAIATVERNAGEEAAELLPLLDNAARVAIMQADFAGAEPHVLRLHALSDALGRPGESANFLFGMIARAREAMSVVPEVTETPDAVGDVEEVVHEAEIVQHEVVVQHEEIVQHEEVMQHEEVVQHEDIVHVAEPVTDVVQFDDIELAENTPVAGDLEQLAELELVEPAPATLDHVPDHRRQVHRDDEALGFLVQHGTSVTPDQPNDVLSGPIGPLPELVLPPRPTPEVASAAPTPASVRPVQTRRTSRDVPVVIPSPAMSQVVIDDDSDDETAAPRNTLLMPGSRTATSVLQDKPRVRATGGARAWVVVAVAVAVLAAALAWNAMRGA